MITKSKRGKEGKRGKWKMDIDAYFDLTRQEQLKEINLQSLVNEDLEEALKRADNEQQCSMIIAEMERRAEAGRYTKKGYAAPEAKDDGMGKPREKTISTGGYYFHKVGAMLLLAAGWVLLLIAGALLVVAIADPYIMNKALHYMVTGLFGICGFICVGFGHVLLLLRHLVMKINNRKNEGL